MLTDPSVNQDMYNFNSWLPNTEWLKYLLIPKQLGQLYVFMCLCVQNSYQASLTIDPHS
jgi:hypothetical protein